MPTLPGFQTSKKDLTRNFRGLAPLVFWECKTPLKKPKPSTTKPLRLRMLNRNPTPLTLDLNPESMERQHPLRRSCGSCARSRPRLS